MIYQYHTNKTVDTIVFDLGGVLIDWNPRYVYRPLFDHNEPEVEHFLNTICTSEWNAQIDAGKPFAQACSELSERYPQQQELIYYWQEKWPEMLGEQLQETVDILYDLQEANIPVYALTNWSAETFPIALDRFPFLSSFLDIVVSGEVGLIKPDPKIYHYLLNQNKLDAQRVVFIDDSLANAKAAAQLGMTAIHFQNKEHMLREQLIQLGLPLKKKT